MTRLPRALSIATLLILAACTSSTNSSPSAEPTATPEPTPTASASPEPTPSPSAADPPKQALHFADRGRGRLHVGGERRSRRAHARPIRLPEPGRRLPGRLPGGVEHERRIRQRADLQLVRADRVRDRGAGQRSRRGRHRDLRGRRRPRISRVEIIDQRERSHRRDAARNAGPRGRGDDGELYQYVVQLGPTPRGGSEPRRAHDEPRWAATST